MAKFYRDHFALHELASDNTITKLSKCLELIEGSEFKDELMELFDFNSLLEADESIAISGLNKIMSSVIQRDKRYKKIDIKTHISDISLVESIDENTIKLRFKNLENSSGEKFSIDAKTVYSSKRDYFEGFYKMEKFANFCISEGHFALLSKNVEYLNEQYEDSDALIKSFRLLQDAEGEYYVRAITSANSYYDYNIRFSLFVTILALHKVTKEAGISFSINYCEYSESFIRVYFEKNNQTIIPEVGKLNFILEMSNDEIKREAFKFSGVFTLTINTNNEEARIYLKPKSIKTKLISIKHNYLPKTVTEYLAMLADFIRSAEEEMTEDIKEIHKIKNPDELRFTLSRKIELSNTLGLADFKKVIKETLDVKINNVSELLVLMDKVDKIVTDLELKEYLRYVYYDLLRDKNNPKDSDSK